ncbi:hypothetical protein P279_06380 [Rhodobacteraceae bacterium PD-2]|nr:hypothetical protein P279_06380 [Rhodobacteraceae bacterium PD-2]
MKPVVALVSLCLLAACAGGGGPRAEAPGNDGVADRLAIGATQADIEAQLGLERGFERNPADFDESCVSFVYARGGQERFVHAIFRDDRLVRASDGHGGLCTYGSRASKEV